MLASLLRWLRLTKGAPSLSGKDPPSKMLWLRENAADIWPRVHKLLDVKDYMIQRLTGRFTTSLMREFGGSLLGKERAEGVYAVGASSRRSRLSRSSNRTPRN